MFLKISVEAIEGNGEINKFSFARNINEPVLIQDSTDLLMLAGETIGNELERILDVDKEMKLPEATVYKCNAGPEMDTQPPSY